MTKMIVTTAFSLSRGTQVRTYKPQNGKFSIKC